MRCQSGWIAIYCLCSGQVGLFGFTIQIADFLLYISWADKDTYRGDSQEDMACRLKGSKKTFQASMKLCFIIMMADDCCYSRCQHNWDVKLHSDAEHKSFIKKTYVLFQFMLSFCLNSLSFSNTFPFSLSGFDC